MYIYIFFPFSLFVEVYVYASLCDFVCIGLLLPFVLGFCLFVVLFLFLFLLLFLFFFSLPFLLSRVVGRVLVRQPGVRPEPLRWGGQVQDIGPPETSKPHVMSVSESFPRDLPLNTKTQLHPTASKL